MMSHFTFAWNALRQFTAVRWFPVLLAVTLALGWSPGIAQFWDSAAAPVAAPTAAIVYGPLFGAVAAYDCRRLCAPSWLLPIRASRNTGAFYVMNLLATATAGTVSHVLLTASAVAASWALGSTPLWSPAAGWNGLPLVWAAVGIGLLCGAYIPSLASAPIAGMLSYALILPKLNLQGVPVLEPLGGLGPVSTFSYNMSHVYFRVIVGAAILVAGLAAATWNRTRLRFAVIVRSAAVILATAALALSAVPSFQEPRIRDKSNVPLHCVGERPRVCLPVGREGYAEGVQSQLAQHNQVLQRLGVEGPQEYRMTWRELADKTGNIGELPGHGPQHWSGRYNDRDIVEMLSTPTVKTDCMPQSPEQAERHGLLRLWMYQQFGIEYGPPDPIDTAMAREVYLELQSCQLAP